MGLRRLADSLRELAECERLFGENVLFVERLLSITAAVSVGKMLTQTEAYEKILSSQGYHISEGPPVVVPSLLDYVDVSSKFWGVLSTIPILLQAKSYNRVSVLLSFLIILLDLNRRWLYRIYEGAFDSFSKFVKLHIFKKRTALYNIFSLFSSRWRYCDPLKRHAYVAKPGDVVKMRPYCKLKSMKDFKINDFEEYGSAAKIQNLCIEIIINRAHVSLMQYNVPYTVVTLKRSIYESDHNLSLPSIEDYRKYKDYREGKSGRTITEHYSCCCCATKGVKAQAWDRLLPPVPKHEHELASLF